MADKEFADQVFEVRCKSDCIITIKLVVGAEILNMINVYAPQTGLTDDINKQFWEGLDMVFRVYLKVRNFS